MNHTTLFDTVRSALFTRTAPRSAATARAAACVARSIFEPMERRQLMSATAVKSIDSAGPDEEMLSAGGATYVISSTASGAGNSLIYSTRGPASTTKKLVDVSNGSAISSLSDLTATTDGRVFFTATGGTGSGRQLFQVNTSKSGYTQITKDTQAFYSDVIAIGNKIYLYDSTHEQIVTLGSKNQTQLVVKAQIVDWYQARGQLFYSMGDDGVFRTDGTAGGTYKISGNATVGHSDVFVSNDWIYFEGTEGNLTSLYRSDGSNSAPVRIAEDFSLLNTSSAELGDYVYFSGGYYNTSPKGGDGFQLIRVKTSTGDVEVVSHLDGGRADGIYASGTNIYYTADDGDYITSVGWSDRELYRYDTVSNVNNLITTGEQLYPVDDQGDGGGAGVLGSYYFTASPTKDESRYGIRKIYRTNPIDDSIEEVGGLPSLSEHLAEVRGLLAGPSGLMANVEIGGDEYDTDVFFVPTPFSYIDPVSKVLIVTGTEGSDTLAVKRLHGELVMNLNGVEERQTISQFVSINIALKAGDDKLVTDANVTANMSVNGDSGNDTLTTGSGNDSILSGSGKNQLYGGAGNDRLRGSNGSEFMNGGDGKDRLYGRGGSDNLRGANGVDFLYGDDSTGAMGNDTLAGDQSADKLYGYGGDDLLIGGGQNDSVFGGDGNDTMRGQDGNDTLDGGAGLDELWGDAGDDLFFAQDSALDLLNGGAGNDTATRDTDEKSIDLVEL